MTRHGRSIAGGLALVVISASLVVAALIAPAGAHVGGTLSHLWGAPGHIKAKVMQLVYTKAQSNARYLGKSAKAANANLLDGQDSSSFINAAGGGLTRTGQTVSIADGGVGSAQIADGSIQDQDLGSFRTMSVSSTDLIVVQSLFFSSGSLSGVTSGRFIISINGQDEGGAGTVTVFRGPGCSGTLIASFTVSGSGGSPATTVFTPSFAISATPGEQTATVCASATSGANPMILRSVDLQVA